MARKKRGTQPRVWRMSSSPCTPVPFKSPTINRLSQRDRMGRRWGGTCSGDGRKFARIVSREARIAGQLCREHGVGTFGNVLLAIHNEYRSRSFETDHDALRWALENWTTIEGVVGPLDFVQYEMGRDGMPERVLPVMSRRERTNRRG